MKAVIVALEVVMTRKINYNINTPLRIENEFHTVVFMAMSMSGSMRWRSVSVV
jgi:hypothetical protein